MQSNDPNVLNATGDDPSTETIDSGIVTFQPRGLVPESVLTDTMMGADTSTLTQGHPHQIGASPEWYQTKIVWSKSANPGTR